MTVLFSVVLLLLLTTWFIEYPDVLQAKIVVTTSTPPYMLVSRTSGNLLLLKKENENVKKGEVIASLRTGILPESVFDLERKMMSQEYFVSYSENSLGELEQDYATLVNASLSLQTFRETEVYDVQIRQLRKQEITYRKLQRSLLAQLQLASQELTLAKEKFKMDSLLYTQKVTAAVDFNKDRAVWLQQQRAFGNTETALVNNEIQLNQLSKQISDLEIQKIEQKGKLETAFNNSRKAMLAHIAKWKETFLFIAPADGKVAYIGFKENEMFTDAGRPLFSVLPVDDTLIARAELPLHNSGKVKEGQRVNIRLENYPFEQYGSITGIVSSISQIPNEDKYFMNITLPDGLKTNRDKTLAFKQQLSGTTEIITEELRLMERFFYQFRRLLEVR